LNTLGKKLVEWRDNFVKFTNTINSTSNVSVRTAREEKKTQQRQQQQPSSVYSQNEKELLNNLSRDAFNLKLSDLTMRFTNSIDDTTLNVWKAALGFQSPLYLALKKNPIKFTSVSLRSKTNELAIAIVSFVS
jgi:hypothetical protein